jgi:hypothetical protein
LAHRPRNMGGESERNEGCGVGEDESERGTKKGRRGGGRQKRRERDD